jgi:dienelactone hydrolase
MPVSLTVRLARLSLAGLLMASLAGPLTAQQQAPGDRDAFRRAQEEFNRVPNTPGDGPYPATIETDPGLPGHVIYRPADLSPFAGGKLPIVVWGNGACVDDGTAHRLHLAEIASYGYLVIAAGAWRSGPGATEPRAQQPAPTSGGLPPAATTAADVRAGIDWAIAEDGRAGSRFKGKVATDAVAVAGHSCGGLQAIEIAADPRVKTVLVHNSGVFNDGASPIPGITVTKAMLDRIHTPMIYILGGPTDIAYPNGTDDFARLNAVPAVLANLPVGHGGTFSEPMGGAVAHVAVDWLEWQLKGDKAAARTFVGDNCRLCTGTDWSIERKGL